MAETAESGPARRRLFFGLQPAASLRMAAWRLARALPLARERLTHPDDLHVTLAFLGMVAEETMPCLLEAAGRVQAAPFELRLDSLDYWSRPKVAVLGASEVPVALGQLVDQLWSALADCGFEPEQRPYKPHLTLARRGGVVERGRIDPPLSWEVVDFVLMESLSVPEPPRYKVLQRWPLAGNQG